MDTTTVLEIIKMLDQRIDESDKALNEFGDDDIAGSLNALESFRDHLQGYIESEVSKAENQTGE